MNEQGNFEDRYEDQLAKPMEMEGNTEEEGTVVLDPEMKKKIQEQKEAQAAKIEKMKTLNKNINETINKLAEENGLKIMCVAFHEELDEEGIWASENVNNMEMIGLAKLVSSKFQ